MITENPDVLWYRHRYNLTSNDPRLLGLTEIEIAMEREAFLAAQGNRLGHCKACGCKSYRDQCPQCGHEEFGIETGDPVIDEILRRKEAGEKVHLDEYFKPGGKAYQVE